MNKILVSLYLLTLISATAEADVHIGGNVIWHDAAHGATIEILGPHDDLDIQAIIDNIEDATETKPYLIELGAGLYDLGDKQIVMKHFVSIRGAGIGVTRIHSSVSSGEPATSAVIVGASAVNMSEFEVSNSGGSGYSIAIYNISARPVIDRVSAIALTGETGTAAIWNDASSPTITQSSARASWGSSDNIGVNNRNASDPIMFQVVATGQGGSSSFGISNNGSSPRMNEVTATGSGLGTVYGVINKGAAAPVIQNSFLSGNTNGLFNWRDCPSTRVANSMIIGGVVNYATAQDVGNPNVDKLAICRGNYDADLQDVSCKTTRL